MRGREKGRGRGGVAERNVDKYSYSFVFFLYGGERQQFLIWHRFVRRVRERKSPVTNRVEGFPPLETGNF